MQPLDLYTSATESLTLLDLQRLVRTTLEGRFRDPLWISAEVSEMKVNRSGHCYLNLVEKGQTDGAPRAEARAVIWKSAYATLANYFHSTTGRELMAGMRLLVRVVITYHEVYGFSLQIIDIDPNYTLGEVERRRRETIARLEADGVWDMNHELELPRPTLRLAVVSSATAAGLRDFMQEIGRTPYPIRTTLFESLMQGEGAERSIIAALEAIADREELFDAVVIIRGGGSTSDLALFDSYDIASHVAQFPLPIITGIGHDKDVSVTDMVAHTSCKTPTAVATLLAERLDEESYTIENLSLQLRDLAKARLGDSRLLLERLTAELTRSTVVTLSGMSHHLDTMEEALVTATNNRLANERQRIDTAERVIDSHSPKHLLNIGYSLLRAANRVVGSVDGVEVGDTIEVELCDGRIEAEIKSKQKIE